MQDLYNFFNDLNTEEQRNDPAINVNDIYTNLNANNHQNAPFPSVEIDKCIKLLNNNKTTGIDNVLNEYIKCTKTQMLPICVKLFNIILETCYIPSNWSECIIIPIVKNKGDSKDPENYRPITLLSCVGKLFTSILNERLNKHINQNEILQENQAGFRQNDSTTDHIFTLTSIIEILKHQKNKVCCCYIDFTKAFDSVWRYGLWQKLLKYEIKGNFFIEIYNMNSNIKSCIRNPVKEPNCYSDFFNCSVGVCQGENLSPVLFSLFLNDLEEFLVSNNNNGISLIHQLNYYLSSESYYYFI